MTQLFTIKEQEMRLHPKVTLVSMPDPFYDGIGWVAFYGHHMIPSRGREHAYKLSNSEMRIGDCIFTTKKSAEQNAQWWVENFEKENEK